LVLSAGFGSYLQDSSLKILGLPSLADARFGDSLG
jgi:hypothetical protein